VNLDPLIYQVIEESVNMMKMQLPVPRDAQLLLYSKQRLRRHHALLLQVLKDNNEIRTKIEDFSQPLFNTSLKKVHLTDLVKIALQLVILNPFKVRKLVSKYESIYKAQ